MLGLLQNMSAGDPTWVLMPVWSHLTNWDIFKGLAWLISFKSRIWYFLNVIGIYYWENVLCYDSYREIMNSCQMAQQVKSPYGQEWSEAQGGVGLSSDVPSLDFESWLCHLRCGHCTAWVSAFSRGLVSLWADWQVVVTQCLAPVGCSVHAVIFLPFRLADQKTLLPSYKEQEFVTCYWHGGMWM